VTLADQLTLTNKKSKVVKGAVPKVFILACKSMNKKITTMCNFDTFQLDLTEMCTYFRNKCQCSVTTFTDVKTKTNAIQIQGNQCSVVEEALVKRYKVPAKYLNIEDKVPAKGKRKKR